MKRKMKVIKEYFDSISINYMYEYGIGDETGLVYYKDGVSYSSTHSSFDEAVDYLYEMAVKDMNGGQPE